MVPPGIVGQFMKQDLPEFRAGELQDAPGGDHDGGATGGNQDGHFELVGDPQGHFALQARFGQAPVE